MRIKVLALGVALIAVAGLTVGIVQAKNGASKFDVLDWDGAVAGWFNANLASSGKLILEFHLDNGPPSDSVAVYLGVSIYFGSGKPISLKIGKIGPIETNKQGKGNLHATVDLDDYLEYDPTSIDMSVLMSGLNSGDKFSGFGELFLD